MKSPNNSKPAVSKLHMEYSCPKKWENLSAGQNGKHCNSCNTEIVDFSNSTDEEIREFFLHKASSSLCAKIKTSQLSSIRNQASNFIPNIKAPWIKRAASWLLSIGGLIGLQAGNSQNIVAQPLDFKTVQQDITGEFETKFKLKPEILNVTGKISCQTTGEPLIGANVFVVNPDDGTLLDESVGAIVDFDGHFNLQIPRTILSDKFFTLKVSYIGYSNVWINQIPVSDDPVAIALEMTDQEHYTIEGEKTEGPICVLGIIIFEDNHGKLNKAEREVTLDGFKISLK